MKHEDRVGKAGQELAAAALRRLGVEMVERVATPAKYIPTKEPGVFRVIWEEPVSGDHRGILPGGRSVLAEVKTILDRNLRWSDLRDHQPGALSDHARWGGLSLLVWVHTTGVYIMDWTNLGGEFDRPGAGLKPEQAARLTLESAQ